MIVDRVRTGIGRVRFHMANNQLDFTCDEGIDSAFTGIRGGKDFPPLESLKGCVETDEQGHPCRLLLRGFLGDKLFETRTAREKDGSRTYAILTEPRGGDTEKFSFRQPFWRIKLVVTDYFVVDAQTVKQRNLPFAEFEVEADARHFPPPDLPELLPAGFLNVSGHVYAKGRFNRDLRLHFDTISLEDGGGISYGAAKLSPDEARSNFAPLWQSLLTLFGTDIPWHLRDVSLHGEADVQFAKEPFHIVGATITNVKLESGTLEHANRTTDVGALGLQVSATHAPSAQDPTGSGSDIQIRAGIPDLWQVHLKGSWNEKDGKPQGLFVLKEENVPYLLHPQRETLEARFVSEDKRRINRTTTVTIKNGETYREVRP